jgi:molybdate transport system substrate-binding protein
MKNAGARPAASRRAVLPALLAMVAAAICTSQPGWAQQTAAPLPTAPVKVALITVFAAASLNDAVTAIAQEFTRSSGIAVRTSFAASSALAHQIEDGAPADVFFSADTDWMDHLQQRGLIVTATRTDLLGNRLVLIAPADRPVTLVVGPHFPLAAALGTHGRLAVADPESVPAGRYARAALTALGVWDAVAPRLVRADNVRAALAFVARGEVPLGIVYETDASIDPHVSIVGVFPPDSHAPIVYPVALTRDAKPEARRFIEFLRGTAATAEFQQFGFTPLAPAP